jgi:nucleoside-diphosphate-sugar epimerase
MAAVAALVTGATGFIGSHVAERLCQEGYRVRTIARRTSDTRLLEQWGVEIFQGDVADPAKLAPVIDGVQVIVHCAAMVGDWGQVEAYRRVNVEGLRHMLELASNQRLDRFVHMSSLGVYEARNHFGTDESVEPPTRHIDGYTQTKVESEKLVIEFHRSRGLPATILRPGVVYGPRDRNFLPRLLENIRIRRFRYFGSGDQAMNSIYVGNLVQATMLALKNPAAVGQIYNLTDDCPTSKRRFVGTVARLAGYPEPTRKIPLALAKFLATVLEAVARLRDQQDAPLVNKARVKFFGLNLDFSCAKAKRELGYQPQSNFDDAMKTTINWFRSEGLIQPAATMEPAAAGGGGG